MAAKNFKVLMLLTGEINRGYYMAAQRYEISLGVLKNICQHEKRNFVSPSDHVIFFLLYKIPTLQTC